MEMKDNKKSLLNSGLVAEPYSICNIKEIVQFSFISNDMYQKCINNAQGDENVMKHAIKDCARVSCQMTNNVFEKAEQIDYIIALYKSQIVGTYKLIGKPMFRFELGEDYIENTFPLYPVEVRNSEKLYTKFCAKASSLGEAESICEANNELLSVGQLYTVVGITKKTKDKNKAFENWRNDVFCDLETVELAEFAERKLLLIPTGNDVNNLEESRKLTKMDLRNFDLTPDGFKVRDESFYAQKNIARNVSFKSESTEIQSDDYISSNNSSERKNTTIQSIIFICLPLFFVILSPIMFINSLIDNNTDMIMFWLMALPISIGILLLCLKLIKYCCPQCGGFFCMRKANEKILSRREITMQETRKIEKYSNYKKQYGNYETYTVDVPGVEYEMDVTYHCSKCDKYVTRREIERYKL